MMEERMKKAMDALGNEHESIPLSPLLRERILHSAGKDRKGSTTKNAIKTKWFLVATLVFVFATGFTSITLYKIQNQAKETVIEYQASPPLSKERLAQLQASQAKLDEVRSGLKPGTAAAVFQKNEAGQGEVIYIVNPLKVRELSELNTLVQGVLDYPARIADTYDFTEGLISYDYTKDESLEVSLKNRGLENKQELIAEPLPALPTYYQVSATYEDPTGNLLRVNGWKQDWEGKGMITVPGANQTVEEVQISGLEGLYIERDDPFGKPRKELRWMDQDWSLSLHTTDTGMSKDAMLDIASQIMERRP
ncbi:MULTISPECIES: hypothetical protein [Brevibacillus]|uniref:DUF4367 domain-containing protein n=1 Tax=Brevibacillus invocatus TaxID=173959 RepID=A0A3M8C8E0_9BACL|nr:MULTISPECIES: hypothetical protein [Brevibacillus]MDH4617787.1 hypothetical protein [Brevibacillus sp. AY1]RNB71984.1 hypothetical protein EDM52_14585 [Brevibacillus invocatus]